MDNPVPRHIVISAVNIRKGGTLTVLRDCLQYLSCRKDLKITAIVHRKDLCEYPEINYMEIPWSIKSWGRRLWCEYRTLKGISDSLQPVDLWFSLHDTTPSVKAERQAVYCQTSFPFLKIKARDFLMDRKIPLFAMFTKYAYRINVRRNRFLVVQQQWLREGLACRLNLPENRFIVAPPSFQAPAISDSSSGETVPMFLYPASPDCHKNFETLCQASELLENRIGKGKFKVVLTVDGCENRYSHWLHKKWGHVESIDFHGYMSKDELYDHYSRAASLVFPSRVETWGLPISEFKPLGKPMILADLPYARESSAGAGHVAFFTPCDAQGLAGKMELVIHGNLCNFVSIIPGSVQEPFAPSWEGLFGLLLEDEDTSAR